MRQNTKTILANGGFYIGQTYIYDHYLITVDESKNVKYYHPKTVNDSNTLNVWYWKQARSVGKNILIQANNKYIFGVGPFDQISFTSLGIPTLSSYYMISDLNGTVYSINTDYNDYYVVAFYADGTYQRLLADTKIKNFKYEKASGIVRLYSQKGIYEVHGKNLTALTVPKYARLGKSPLIGGARLSNSAYAANVIITTQRS